MRTIKQQYRFDEIPAKLNISNSKDEDTCEIIHKKLPSSHKVNVLTEF